MSGDIHKNLAVRTIPWIRSRTTRRGIQFGFEVPLADSYVADAVALCGMQHRFERQYVSERALERRNGTLVSPEFACVFEAKATRNDFLATFRTQTPLDYLVTGSRLSPAGSLHWVVVPHLDIVGDTQLLFWGVLVVSGSGLREVRPPQYKAMTFSDVCRIGYYLLWYGKDAPG